MQSLFVMLLLVIVSSSCCVDAPAIFGLMGFIFVGRGGSGIFNLFDVGGKACLSTGNVFSTLYRCKGIHVSICNDILSEILVESMKICMLDICLFPQLWCHQVIPN
jgi:hypothetical protein